MKALRFLFAVCCAVMVSCTEKPEVPETPSGDVNVPETPAGDMTVPELPADPEPGNTSFNHRILLLQHTGTDCSNCPNLMTSLKALSEMDEYASKYQHVAAHSYNETGDPAYSQAAANLSQAFGDGYYPELTFNLTKENTGTSLAVSTITGIIDQLHKEIADVGIAAAAGLSGSTLEVNVQIKAAKAGQYRIAVWVLEDGIRGKQAGASEDWMNTHNNAVRAMAGNTLNMRIYGEKMGGLQVGQTADKSFSVALDEAWKTENCKVLVVVNAAGADGRYDLANCVLCPLGGVVAYDYNKAGQNPEKPQDAGFKIEVFDMNSSHCKVKVVPENKTAPYFCGVATEDYLKTFGSLDDMMTTATNFIETTILENSDVAISDLMKVGEYEREVTGLKPEQRFVVFACYTDETGAVTSEITMVVETTPALEQVAMEFDIELDQITATSAMLFITPTTDDEYVWLEFPEDVYKDMTMEELQDFLLKNYKPFFPLHTNTGEMVHSFDNKLDPDTEYMIIVFGYDGGLTTPLFTKKFRTLTPNDPADVTFEISYNNLTARSATVTFKPSDASVAYLAIVAGEDELERNGGPTAEGVKKLIDKEIKKAILVGDCEDRAEFAKYYAQRGTATGSFSLKPGMRHYACAVCLDAKGEYASEVAICWFDAPAEGSTDASVSASVLKFFDGDALCASNSSYSDFAGWAVVRLKFVLGGSAKDAIFTIYPVDVLEQEGATDDDIRAMLLDDSLLGEYNYNIEALTDVQLDWGCDYRLYAIPFDASENTGELFKLDIPALSRTHASPISEY